MSDNFYKINRGINLGPQAGEPSNPSNGDIYYDTSLNKFRKYENGSWSDLGSSNSAENKNFITNGDAEANTLGWSTYADAAGTRPVDGTGGSPTVTFTRSTSSPLEGLGSFLFTKDAANRQGQGVSYDFTIDQAYKAKVLSIELDYQVVSGTFAAGSSSTDSDLIVYLYDVTNSTLIEPSSIKLLSNSTTFTDRFKSTFQTSATGTQYRLIIHCATNSASAYVVKFDNISVSPSNYIFGTPITDWQSFIPTGSFTTNTTYTGLYRRVGDQAEIQYKLSFAGAPNAVANTILNLPAGLSMNLDKLIDTTAASSLIVDNTSVLWDLSGTANYKLSGNVNNSTSIVLSQVKTVTGTNPVNVVSGNSVTNTSPVTIASGDSIIVKIRVPIVGWSSSVQMSDSTDTRIVAFHAIRGTDQTGVNTNNSAIKITFNTITTDSHGSFDTSTNRYNIPIAGLYKITGSLSLNNANIVANRYSVDIYKNGSLLIRGSNRVFNAGQGNVITAETPAVSCIAGDYFEIFLFGAGDNSASTISINSSSATTFISGERLSGPSAIAATETVSLKYQNNAGTSVPAAGSIVSYTTKIHDTHNAFNGTTFTAPLSGKYRISANVYYDSASWGISTASVRIRKNTVGSDFISITTRQVAHTGFLGFNGSTEIDLIAGDQIDFFHNHNEATSRSLNTTVGTNYICITRIGN